MLKGWQCWRGVRNHHSTRISRHKHRTAPNRGFLCFCGLVCRGAEMSRYGTLFPIAGHGGVNAEIKRRAWGSRTPHKVCGRNGKFFRFLRTTFCICRARKCGSRRERVWELLYNYIELIIGFYYRDYPIGLYRAIYSARYRVFAREKNFKIVAILAVKKATDRNKPLHHEAACV